MSPQRTVDQTFRRVRDAYDLERMSSCTVVYVGVGGAVAFAEDLARAGVGRHVLIDRDVVSETNLATQQVYRRDIGRPKVDCVAERIRDINPAAVVVARQQFLDELDDTTFQALAAPDINSVSGRVADSGPTLLCGLTDDFAAQARVNRLALHLGLPSLCAQVYKEGRGAELTFTHPATTPTCHRCVLSSRYRAFLEEGFRNDVTSDGTPIFATTRLNALKGFVALAILHQGMCPIMPYSSVRPGFMRWGTLLERIANRNLIQIRMDPDLGENLGLKVFDRVFAGGDQDRILFDEVVWLPQQPETDPPCPDCGGTGDLRQAIGTFTDTRVMASPSLEASK